MMLISDDPIELAIQLRAWADDESLAGVKFSRDECRKIADMLDQSRIAPDQPIKWDDPDPPMGAPADAKRPICQVCGISPNSDDPCGFSQCPALIG